MAAGSDALSLKGFLEQPRPTEAGQWLAVSLFSSAGLSDVGYEMAGFRFLVQIELLQLRAEIGRKNFPDSQWLVQDIVGGADAVTEAFRKQAGDEDELDLLVATPPCQGMSSSNPSRGKRQDGHDGHNDPRNRLILEIGPVAKKLRPKLIVAENVRQVLTLQVTHGDRVGRVIDLLREDLSDYALHEAVVNVADYGIPQARRRAVLVAVRKDLPSVAAPEGFLPIPRPTHAQAAHDGLLPWVSVREWFEEMGYEKLDAGSEKTAKGTHRLHYVPVYEDDRYLRVSQIPPNSGRNAYQNDRCPACGHHGVPEGLAYCAKCHEVMRNRPYVIREDGTARPVKGFHSSYRRMSPDLPAPTITTNTSHMGGDYKLHPWENRVLSALECADLQTVPRWYDWSPALEAVRPRPHIIRHIVGEAFPPYFTYLHGLVLGELLSREGPDAALLVKAAD